MKLLIKNLTGQPVSTPIGTLQPGSSLSHDLPESQLEAVTAELVKLGSRVSYAVGDLAAGRSITSPLTLFVETTGSDSNPGTKGSPYRTIQAALDSLKGVEIAAAVTVQVGEGEFAGFIIPDLHGTSDGQLSVLGTLIPAVGVTSNSGTQNVTQSYSIAVDTNLALTTDELKGLLIEYYTNATTTTKTYNLIQSNTSDTITYLGLSAPYLGRPFRILQWGTKIARDHTSPQNSSFKSAISIRGPTLGTCKSAGITINNFEVLETAGASFGIDISNSQDVAISYVKVSLQVSQYGIYATGNSAVTMNAVYIYHGNVSTYGITSSDYATKMVVNRVYTLGTLGATQRGLYLRAGSVLGAGSVFESMTNAVTGANSTTGSNGTVFAEMGFEFINCTTCYSARGSIQVRNGRSTYPGFAIQGYGNTNYILASGGSRYAIGATVPNGVATNEITMLHANPVTVYTLAQMRANTPRAVVDTIGTAVGETGVVL